MISLLQGAVYAKQKDAITLLTRGGVGYHVRMSPLHVAECRIGDELTLCTFLKVSDSALDVYGFFSEEERSFFEVLLSVKGVGPKSALNILALGSIVHIQSAIARGDAQYLSTVQGMGKKTAERLCVELKNKVSVGEETQTMSKEEAVVVGEVIDGLVALGYSKEEAKERVTRLSTKEKTTEQLLKESLSQ